MALGTTIGMTSEPVGDTIVVLPVSLSSRWKNIIDPGGMDDQDAATITNPTTQITLGTRKIFKRRANGTTLLVSLAYDDGLTSITNPVIKLFGRYDSTEAWRVVLTKGGSLTATFAVASTDSTDGTNLYTPANYDTIAWDCLGYEEFVMGVETALAGTGDATTAYLQGKFI